MRIVTLTAIAAIMLLATTVKAQDQSPVNFDKVTAADFTSFDSKADTSYGAIILADIGKSSFEANGKGFFSLVFKLQRRVKITSPKGFDLATVKIPLYKSVKTDLEESLESLKASTYNLVNGKVEETKLNKDDVFREVMDKNHVVKKFTLPAIKEGSIFDISYTIKSDFLFNLQPWTFQGSYPRLWSEYVLNLPEFFEYIFLSKGSHPLHIKDAKEKFQNYIIRIPAENLVRGSDEMVGLSSTNTISRWVMKDVPVLKEEAFTTSMSNHQSYMEFQMAGQRFPNMPYRDVMGTWRIARESMMKDPDFGAGLGESNSWANETMSSLSLDSKTPIEKAKAIYYYVQKNIKNLGARGHELSQTLKQTYNTKKGYVPDINMLLVMLMKKADLVASPVLLSTAENGVASYQYPIVGQYNYLVAIVRVGDQEFLLDASNPGLGFGKLNADNYNGMSIAMDAMVSFIPLYADSITEKKLTYVKLMNDPGTKGKWSGMFQSQLGYYESLDIRDDLREKGTEAYLKKLEESYSGDYSIDKINMQHAEEPEKAILMNYAVAIDRSADADMIYFNPMIKEGIKENYFKSSERLYPVEAPFKLDESYKLDIAVPEGFVVEETPKSTRVSLNETDGSFEYIITKDENVVSLQTRLKLNKTFFPTEEYEALRGFFDYVVKKHAEQIVFKKKR